MSDRRIRALVVDDSAFARKVLREVLMMHPRIDVVGSARDGLDALEKIAELAPDVVTLDLVMPELDGIGVLRALREQRAQGRPLPRVVAVTMSDAESELGLAALEGGAVEVVHKPTALATDRLYDLRDEVIAKVVAAAEAATASVPPSLDASTRRRTRPPATKRRGTRTSVVVVGASTGGPQAISSLLHALAEPLGAPLAIVVHMPPGYTEAFAARLAGATGLDVREASEGLALEPGRVVIARAGMHLRIDRARAEVSPNPIGTLHRPSVDELFRSAAAAHGAGALGVVLTGMGSDGLEGARAIRAAGGRVIAQSGETCVVDGMPRSIREADLATRVEPLDEIAAAIVDEL